MSRRVALVVFLIGVLFACTTLLARSYHEQRDGRARAHFERGRAFDARGEPGQALGEYRAALSLVRDSPEYGRALAHALVALGRYDEASTWAGELLRQAPTDGDINRTMARIARGRQRDEEARLYFQRAVYGEWPDDPSGRIETRFELLDYLRDSGRQDEALAEMLRLKVELPAADTTHARRLASLLMDDGRLADARDVLHGALEAAPRDPALRVQVAEADRTLALDPTLPGLRLAERNRRAARLLAAVWSHVGSCVEARDDLRDLATLTRAELERRSRRAGDAEDQLALAGQLWNAAASCQGSSPEQQAIARVLRAVAAHEGPGA